MAGSDRDWVVEESVEGMTHDGEIVLSAGYDRERARELLLNLESMLFEAGGMFYVAAERVQVGEAANGRPLAVSRRLIVEFRSFSPLRRESTNGTAPEPEQAEPGAGDDGAVMNVEDDGDAWDVEEEEEQETPPAEEPLSDEQMEAAEAAFIKES